jgi:micrococcal nuclease
MRPLALAIAACLLALPASAETYTYQGYLVRVIDGDSLVIDVPDWPAPFRPARVRVDGINAPESRRGKGGAKCEIERDLGKQVNAWLRERLPKGSPVTLIWEGKREKYGRLLGKVLMPDGQDIAEAIVKAGYAVNYAGGRRLGWCRYGR